MVDIREVVEQLEKRQTGILTGLADKGKDLEQTNFERGRFAELKTIISVLKEKAAE